MDFKQFGELPDYPAYFISDGTNLFTLWQTTEPEQATPFNRKTNVGLHHFALKVNSVKTLNAAYDKLKGRKDVEIELGPEQLGGGSTQHMMFYMPGGIRMELMAIAS